MKAVNGASTNKVVNDVVPPSIPLPSIFSKIASLLKNHYEGKPTGELHVDLPPGIVSLGEKWVRSQTIQLLNHKHSCYISGRFDIVISFDDGSYGIIDFKTSDPKTLEPNEGDPHYRTPLTNIIENEDLYYILVELPGLDKKHVNISLQEGILELRGEKAIKVKEKKEKKDEKKEKDKKKEKYKKIKGDFLRREIRSTNFFRCFHLPDDIAPEEIDASFKNGILRLKIPKKTTETDEKKVIEIK